MPKDRQTCIVAPSLNLKTQVRTCSVTKHLEKLDKTSCSYEYVLSSNHSVYRLSILQLYFLQPVANKIVE